MELGGPREAIAQGSKLRTDLSQLLSTVSDRPREGAGRRRQAPAGEASGAGKSLGGDKRWRLGMDREESNAIERQKARDRGQKTGTSRKWRKRQRQGVERSPEGQGRETESRGTIDQVPGTERPGA